MTKIPKRSPSTLAELKTNILTLRTKLEQIEYLSVVILDLQDGGDNGLQVPDTGKIRRRLLGLHIFGFLH